MNSEIKFISVIALITVLVVGGGLYISAKNGGQTGIPKPVLKNEILIKAGNPVIENGVASFAKDSSISTSTVTIVEFADYACPACSALEPEMEKLLKADPTIKYVYRTVPIHASSKQEANMVYASVAQGKFKEFASAVFTNQQEWDKTGVDFIPFFEKYAKSVGIDTVKLEAEAKNPVYLATIETDAKDAEALSIYATPTVIFVGPKGSTYVQGAVQESELQKMVDSVSK
ncbi:MAG: thioredoxin domain-containing protein [bacterium]